eukprot:m.705011 g.705011  ORF g.705011 m.705011 type:complete len:82 (+) comp22922_c0_seq1:88-333(+)
MFYRPRSESAPQVLGLGGTQIAHATTRTDIRYLQITHSLSLDRVQAVCENVRLLLRRSASTQALLFDGSSGTHSRRIMSST